MSERHQMIPAVGLAATCIAAVYMVVQLSAQTASPTRDFTNASVAEVRDAQGHVILSGQFQRSEEEDDDIERKAALAPTGVDADATGEAEVEFDTVSPAEQEVEFSVRNVAPGTVLTFAIDGTDVATATADQRGRVEVEIDVPMAGPVSAR